MLLASAFLVFILFYFTLHIMPLKKGFDKKKRLFRRMDNFAIFFFWNAERRSIDPGGDDAQNAIQH